MPSRRRRHFLRTSGIAAVVGLSGCMFGSSGSKTTTFQGRSYDVRFTNDIAREDLGSEYDGKTKATLSLEVDRVQDGENELLFERSVALDLGSSRTVEDAFSTEPNETYGVNGTLKQPYVDFGRGGSGTPNGFVFDAGGENAPSNGRILVMAYNDRPNASFPNPELRVSGQGPPR